MKEDNSNCIRENTTILFTYTCTDGNDIFLRDISSVDAFIFDESERLVISRRFESGELREFAGWKLNLPPGNYYVTCWGNAGANSQFNNFVSGITALDESFVQIPAHITITGDQLYYAPYKEHPHWRPENTCTRTRSGSDLSMADYSFTVLADRENVKTTAFIRAHRTVNMYITGYSDSRSGSAVVDGTNLCTGYNFYYNSHENYRNFTQTAQSVSTSEGQALLATFHSGFSEITDNIDFTVRQGDGGPVLVAVNLKEFLEENPEAHQNTIDILVRFSTLGVTITMPKWNENPVKPGV